MDHRTELAAPSAPRGLVATNGGPWRFDRWVRMRLANRMFRWFCLASAAFVCLVLFGVIVFVGRTGLLTFQEAGVAEFFFSLDWAPENGQYGAAVFIIGTFALTALTLLMATPLSICIAVFLAEIAPNWLRGFLRPVMDLLVGIPSVVYGYIGLTVLIPLLREWSGSGLGDGLLAAAIVLTFMILPTISRISDDAISSVPRKYRDAAYALGSTRFQVIARVVLPAAKRGIIAAVILGMARAIGETMAVVMVIGNAAQLPEGLLYPTSVLTTTIVGQVLNVPFDSTWSYSLYLMAFLLLAISLLLILIIRLLQRKGDMAHE
ncbi:phosphate ABC transporter permease subunit PstC [Paenibacillus sp.]|uniref:phosphate ABC transporter permease subunit PstC n=1 Tax=Paenibacillus sp. TaxID=58172 RepID=UPI002D6F88D4|nr:phosphate ABC transporter permease subunit PstC [Paenibacillus sp.]HZG83622.1 phosphate ABC transporter permease subunit PstC [Paenibacillus sp.]